MPEKSERLLYKADLEVSPVAPPPSLFCWVSLAIAPGSMSQHHGTTQGKALIYLGLLRISNPEI